MRRVAFAMAVVMASVSMITSSAASVPVPVVFAAVALRGVSCPGAGQCFAVGSYWNGHVDHPFVGRSSGAGWVMTPGAVPKSGATAVESALYGIACPMRTLCFAVGFANAGRRVPLIERWNGTKWAVIPSPARDASSSLSGVACSTSTSCFAVGSSLTDAVHERTLTERWDGTSWRVVPSPSPYPDTHGDLFDQLLAVACPTIRSCVAVGRAAGTGGKTLAERWNGTKWSVVASRNGSGATGNQLSGISCYRETHCFAVGKYLTGDRRHALVERFNGTSWTVEANIEPPGTDFSQLDGISCPTMRVCFATGAKTADPSSGGSALVERWNGTRWSMLTKFSSATVTTGDEPVAISCATPTSCAAVVADRVQRWNGSVWSVVDAATTPNAADQSFSFFNGMTCRPGPACIAVGGVQNDFAGFPLVETGS